MKKYLPFSIRIFFLALVLRLIPVIALRQVGIGLDDMFQYDMLARSLVTGNGYRWYAIQDLRMFEPYVKFDLSSVDYDPLRGVPTSFRAPLYPVFLAIVYFFAGVGSGRFLVARLVQCVLGALLAPLTYALATELIPGDTPQLALRRRRVAVVASWVVACYPMLIMYPFGLATENLFFILLMLSVLFLVKASKSTGKVTYHMLGGGFLALTALTRSVILPFAGLALLWTWFTLKHRKGAIAMGLVFLAMVAPWIVRNSLLHHKLAGIESSMGYNLYVGYHPRSNGSFTFGISLDLIPILDDAERDRIGTQQAIQFIRQDPGRILSLAFNRLSFFFGLEKRVLIYFYANNFIGKLPSGGLVLLLIVMLLPFVVVAGSAPMGLAGIKVDARMILLYLLFFAYILPHVLILSEDRFHLALVPYLAILASHAWVGGLGMIKASWHEPGFGKSIIVLMGMVTLLLFFNWSWELIRDWDTLGQLLGPNGNTLYLPY